MPRPRKCRRVQFAPEITYFKPRGVPLGDLSEAYLSVEGFEALRLCDFEGLPQESAAERMSVSRQTFGRILSEARRTVARALVHGLALKIHGGDYKLIGSTPLNRGYLQEAAAGREEVNNMEKVAVTCEEPKLDSPVDARFGRAAGFLIIDPKTMAFEYLENGAAQARAQGAGIQAAETVAGAGVQTVLTGYVGPKAFQALAAAGIRIVQDMAGLSVRQAVEQYNSGQVTFSVAEEAKGPMQ